MSRSLSEWEYENPGVQPEWIYYWSNDLDGGFLWVVNGSKVTQRVSPVIFSHDIPENRSTRNLMLLSWVVA